MIINTDTQIAGNRCKSSLQLFVLYTSPQTYTRADTVQLHRHSKCAPLRARVTPPPKHYSYIFLSYGHKLEGRERTNNTAEARVGFCSLKFLVVPGGICTSLDLALPLTAMGETPVMFSPCLSIGAIRTDLGLFDSGWWWRPIP